MVDESTQATILVRGSATVDVPPDYATIRIQVSERARSREKALDAVAERTSSVDRILDELGGVVSNRVTASARIVAMRGAGRGDRGFLASRSLVCEIRDHAVLGGLFERLVDADSEFEGPWWHLDDSNPVFEQVRSKAAADARAKAAAYASGVDQEVGKLRWLAEPGLRIGGAPDRPFVAPAAPAPMPPAAAAPGAARFGRGTDERDEPLLDVVVENITVSATVEAGFDLRED